ncbi:hypothetical protein HHI36_017665 [Cryptolaemus montrouzieri]|uniref:Uncharacterized protein n=1 Tax=Cryptolaemus montrouzieri TaxID=559131 RepID=A0ABD2NNJ1_9CUCU
MVSKTPRPTTAELEGRKDEFQKNLSMKLSQINQSTYLNEMCNIITDGLITSTRKLRGRRRIQNSKLSPPTLAFMERRRNTNREYQEYEELNKIIKKAKRRVGRNRQTQMVEQAIEDNMNLRRLRKNLSKGNVRVQKLKDANNYAKYEKTEIINIIQDFYKELYSEKFLPHHVGNRELIKF